MDLDDDHEFSDCDLDDLPASELHEVEATAIRATQHQSNAAAPPPRRDPDESHYGSDADDGDEVINLDDAAIAASRFAHGPNASTTDHGESMDVDSQEPRPSQPAIDHLLQRVQQLERERKALKDAIEATEAKYNVKAGEADNLRRRNEAAARDSEKRRAEQERLYKQQNEHLRAERDDFRRQLEQTKTNNEFDKHEARQEGLTRRPRNMPSRPKAAPVVPATTPKKTHKNIPLGDGFDDESIAMASPSKRRDKSKAVTPKQANKRKRQATNDSPIAPLQLSEPRERPRAPEPVQPAQNKLYLVLLRNFWKDDSRFTLVHRLLSQRSSNGTDRVLEALVQYAFPSKPQKKLSSIVYDSLSTFRSAANVHELAIGVCRIFITLWKQCLQEKYYAPVYLILEGLQFTLACEPAETAVRVTEELVPSIAESIMRVARPVHEASKDMDESKIAALFSSTHQLMVSELQAKNCLELLYVLATSSTSSSDPEAAYRFWRAVPPDIVFLLLKAAQPLSHIVMMLRILSTSALASSIGPIHPEGAAEQRSWEFMLIINLTELLSVKIAPLAGPQGASAKAVTEEHTWQLRLHVVRVLTQFAVAEHGTGALVQHKNCIGRLVHYLNYCITALYTQPLAATQPLKIASINATMRLLHHLYVSTNVQIKSKLNDTLGGQHAVPVARTRLAFSEGLVLEAGIEPEVMDMAHDVLNDGMGPEEGDELMQVFPSGNSA